MYLTICPPVLVYFSYNKCPRGTGRTGDGTGLWTSPRVLRDEVKDELNQGWWERARPAE